MKAHEIPRLIRTVRHLRPSQLAHRGRLRTQLKLLSAAPAAGVIILGGAASHDIVGWPASFVTIDARLSGWPTLGELAAGRITLLGRTEPLTGPGNWRPRDTPQLWRFHLQYWDWAWGLAGADDKDAAREIFTRLFRQWQASQRLGRYDEWSPYVASLRAWAFCGLFAHLSKGSAIEADFIDSLALHRGFVAKHLERDVGGNHLVKNLKACIGLAVFFGDERLLEHSIRALARQLEIQVLPDGGHYERAPSYHAQVLGDVVDISGLLGESGYVPPVALRQAVERMQRWLAVITLPDETVPMFNDGFPVAPEFLRVLRSASPPPEPLTLLRESGYAVLKSGPFWLVADVGDPCPDELPAHAHADTLSFVLYVDGEPVVVDTGTSTYEAGPRRAYERSTAAHSTISIDGGNSTEVYGAFRAGRRARARVLGVSSKPGSTGLIAEHDGYRWLPGSPLHRRAWNVGFDRLVIKDCISGTGHHEAVSRLILSPCPDGSVGLPKGVVLGGSAHFEALSTEVSTGWESRADSILLTSMVPSSIAPAHSDFEFRVG